MKCKKCGNDTFIAHQICRMDIMVDESGEFLRNLTGGAEMHIYDSEKPYGPFTCSKCGAEYDALIDDTPDDDTDCSTGDSYVMYNVMRVRSCENESWSNRIYLKVNADDEENWPQSLLDKNWAKKLLVKRIQKRLASKIGWQSICCASMDYNWGDMVMELPFAEIGVFEELDIQSPPKKLVGIVDLVVNQDELLAPDTVPGELVFCKDDTCFRKVPCIANFQDGTIDVESDESGSIEKATKAYVKLSCGDTIMCDAAEDFMHFQFPNDESLPDDPSFDEDHDNDDGENSWKICREIGHCPILGEHSNPTVFDCDTLCAARKNDN